jgi:hypothetical protein
MEKKQELREIDAMIAEKLFGWVWMADRLRSRRMLVETELCASQLGYVRADGSEPVKYVGHMPKYSTDIADALEAAEKMRERGLRYVIKSPVPDAYLFRVAFYPLELDAISIMSVANESLPEAVARCVAAALQTEPIN